MDTKIKNYLGTAVIIAILVFAYAALSYVKSYSRSIEPSTFRSFSASGEGRVVAIPDIAKFSFSVITQGEKDIALLMKENTGKVNKAIEFLKSKGLETKDIKTQSYNLEPRYQYFSCPLPREKMEIASCPPPEIVGYTITQSISVKIRNFAKIGDVLSGVVSAGANNVFELSFDIDEPEKLQNKAREQAIQKAKEKANLIAKAGGFRVGRLLSIDEGFIEPFSRFEALGKGGEAPAPLPAPAIEPGSQEIIANITLRYEIK